MSILASSGSDSFIFMLCQMEFCSTVDRTQYWNLTPFVARETYKAHHPELDSMAVLQPALSNPADPNHLLAVQVDQYRKSITDLLDIAAAQLTTLYANYPRYVRLALVRRLGERFISWDPIDSERIAALDNVDSEAHRMQTQEADRRERAEKIRKEKQRKKALRKRKQILQKSIADMLSDDQLKQLSEWKRSDVPVAGVHDSSIEGETHAEDIEKQETVIEGAVTATQEGEAPKTPVRSVSPKGLAHLADHNPTTTTDVERCPVRNNSCSQSICPSFPRSSVASIWTFKEESTSTSNTSPSSGDKDQLRTGECFVDLDVPAKAIKGLMTRLLEISPSTSRGKFAATPREEEMNAHIIRVAKSWRGLEAASLMTALLPKTQPKPELSMKEPAKVSKPIFMDPVPIKPSKSTKQKRKARARKEKADSIPARNIDLAGDLLYSASNEDVSTVLIQGEPSPNPNPDISTDDSEIACELDTMSVAPLRGRYFNKAR